MLSYGRALNRELRKARGARCLCVCPFWTKTAFFDRAEANGSIMNIKKQIMADVHGVVEKALWDSCHKKAKSVYSLPVRAFGVLCKAVPHSILVPVIKAVKLMETD